MEREVTPQAVNPGQAIVTGDIRNSRFPERVGRTRSEFLLVPTEEGVTEVMAKAIVANGRHFRVVDCVVLRSVSSMDGRE